MRPQTQNKLNDRCPLWPWVGATGVAWLVQLLSLCINKRIAALFHLLCWNSSVGALRVQVVFICYVSMTTPQRVHAIDSTTTSIIPSLSFLPSRSLCPCRRLPVAELSTDICSLCPDLWPGVADREVSVETCRVRLGLSPGILVPGSALQTCCPSL